MLQQVRGQWDMAGNQYAISWKLRWRVWTVCATRAEASETVWGVHWNRIEDDSAGLPWFWPAHAGLAEDGLCVSGQYQLQQLLHLAVIKHYSSWKKPVIQALVKWPLESLWVRDSAVNSNLVHNPTIWQPGFDLPRQQWFLLNRFASNSACRRKCRLADTDLCSCSDTQTVSHIVKSCSLTKLNGGLSRLHSADEDAVSWLTNYGLWHAYVTGSHKMSLNSIFQIFIF